jgi:hypothetical protein
VGQLCRVINLQHVIQALKGLGHKTDWNLQEPLENLKTCRFTSLSQIYPFSQIFFIYCISRVRDPVP